jgi:hypothetical protein
VTRIDPGVVSLVAELRGHERHYTLMVDGSELELWQGRRLALDGLFFDQTPTTVAVRHKKR